MRPIPRNAALGAMILATGMLTACAGSVSPTSVFEPKLVPLSAEPLQVAGHHGHHAALPKPPAFEVGTEAPPAIPGAKIVYPKRNYHGNEGSVGNIHSWTVKGSLPSKYDWGSAMLCDNASGYNAPVKSVDYVDYYGTRTQILVQCPVNAYYYPNLMNFYWKIPCSSRAVYGGFYWGLGPYAMNGDALTWFKNGLRTGNWAGGTPPPAGYTYPKVDETPAAISYQGAGTFTSLATNKILYRVPDTKILIINHYTGKIKINTYPVVTDEANIKYKRKNFYYLFGAGEDVIFEVNGGIYGYTVEPDYVSNLVDDSPLAYPTDQK